MIATTDLLIDLRFAFEEVHVGFDIKNDLLLAENLDPKRVDIKAGPKFPFSRIPPCAVLCEVALREYLLRWLLVATALADSRNPVMGKDVINFVYLDAKKDVARSDGFDADAAIDEGSRAV